MGSKATERRTSTEEQQQEQLENSSIVTSDSTSTLKKTKAEAEPIKNSKFNGLKKLFKSPAVESYEQIVTQPRKDWGTGNPPGGGPYRPIVATPGMGSYYTAKGGTGSA